MLLLAWAGFGLAPGARAASAWTVTPTPNTAATSDNFLSSVSCASGSLCWAVGYSCTGSCSTGSEVDQAVVEEWNGSAWTLGTAADANGIYPNRLTGVSCPTVSYCMAVGKYKAGAGGVWQTLAETWNGSAWTVNLPSNTSATVSNILSGVSCPSSGFCVAVGAAQTSGTGGATLVDLWNGTTWTLTTGFGVTADGDTLSGVSCASTVDCIAVGGAMTGSVSGEGLVGSFNGTTWTAAAVPSAGGSTDDTLMGVSCVSTSDCVAVGSENGGGIWSPDSEVWNGTTWSNVVMSRGADTGDNTISAVSCSSASYCAAVGTQVTPGTVTTGTTQELGQSQTLTEAWNGTAWNVVSSNNAGGTDANSLAGVACPSGAGACLSVGSFATVGTATTEAPSPVLNPTGDNQLAVAQSNTYSGGTNSPNNGFSSLSNAGNNINTMAYKVLSGTSPTFTEWNVGDVTTTQEALFTPVSQATPIAFVQQQADNITTAGTSTFTMTLPANVTVGDSLVLLFGIGGNYSTIASVSDVPQVWAPPAPSTLRVAFPPGVARATV